MRTVKIENCSYELFESIRDVIYKHMPFVLLNEGYSPKTRIGQFNFWDSDYIPSCLEKYVLRPPKHREPVDKVQKEIEGLFKTPKK